MFHRAAVVLAAAFVIAACSDNEANTPSTNVDGGAGATSDGGAGSGGTGGDDSGAAGGGGQAGSSGNATFKVRQSVEQLDITHATPGDELALDDASGTELQKATTDTQGSLIFRKIPPGTGYVVRTTTATPEQHTGPLTVMSVENSLPADSFYSGQKLSAGSGYITTRDGTQLAIYVTLPGPADKGPYPTVVNYSGYDPARPGAPLPGFENSPLCATVPALCDAPSAPGAEIAAFYGYATVGVNMRGTGCSGGAYDFFETLQRLDGYDVIQTVAAQDWVLNHKVGMVGLSYPGISQMFVAETQPPGLAAITPLSVIGNTFSTLLPGGILNNGFAIQWGTSVLDKADPYGQGWEQPQVDAGDDVCKENQLLHSQKVDIIQEAENNPYYTAELGDPINPEKFVDKINVPVFFASAFQDEQTGPFFFTLLNRFTGAPVVRENVYNGVHVDGFAPQIMAEWHNFLEFYVARRIPSTPAQLSILAPQLFQQAFKLDMSLPPDRFGAYTDYNKALADYEAEDPLRVIFENGGGTTPGAPEGTFEMRFKQFPPAATKPQRWYFEPDGSLGALPPTQTQSASSFQLDPAAGQRGVLAPGGDVWDPLPAYAWPELVPNQAVAFDSAPLTADEVMFGSASVDLWVKSSVDDADLQVTLSEIRPDGKEMYIQSGWLRASQRALAADATTLWADETHLQADATPLPAGKYSLARVVVPAFTHVFRAGSRIRVSVDTPGDVRAAWRFDLKTFSTTAVHTIAHEALHPSSVVLPVLDGVAATTPLPACPSLRGQPCHDYVAFSNTPAN